MAEKDRKEIHTGAPTDELKSDYPKESEEVPTCQNCGNKMVKRKPNLSLGATETESWVCTKCAN